MPSSRRLTSRMRRPIILCDPEKYAGVAAGMGAPVSRSPLAGAVETDTRAGLGTAAAISARGPLAGLS
jgi:hypothetical protein